MAPEILQLHKYDAKVGARCSLHAGTVKQALTA
jgi:hypothetical protein